jgi:hypothetical protein
VITSVCDTPSAVAVSVAFCEALTADVATLKVAEVPPAATVTEAGARSALLLLDSVTTNWLVAAALRDTVQVLVCAPVSDCVPHERPSSVATGAGFGEATGYRMIVSDSVTLSDVAVRFTF